jgi:TldD protein
MTSTRTAAPLIDEGVTARVLRQALATGGEFAEVFAEDRRGCMLAFDDGRIEDISSGHERGAGIRVVVGNTTGFAHTADLSERGLLAAAEAASGAARGAEGGARQVALSRSAPPSPSPAEVLPAGVAKAKKVELLCRADAAARAAGGDLRQLNANYRDSRRQVLVANSDGVFSTDDQVRIRLGISAVANGDTGMQTGSEIVGATMGFELFDRHDVEGLARSAAHRALSKLRARPAPSGTMPVVIKAGTGGVLFHEACGHGLEADHIAKAVSVFTGRVGEQVASPLVTLVDDGTMSHEWGALAIDDEGHPTGRNVLIENGVLTDYMWDWLRARKEGRGSSGNGRRQSYQHLPMVRMTNTFLMNGEEDPEEIIRQTPHGVYVAQLGGGQVNTTTGDFVFGMREAYLIENGGITEPIRDANLIGNGPQVLRDIDVIGNDFAMGFPGTCGKQGQGVPVGMGQPTLRVRGLTIGGTAR